MLYVTWKWLLSGCCEISRLRVRVRTSLPHVFTPLRYVAFSWSLMTFGGGDRFVCGGGGVRVEGWGKCPAAISQRDYRNEIDAQGNTIKYHGGGGERREKNGLEVSDYDDRVWEGESGSGWNATCAGRMTFITTMKGKTESCTVGGWERGNIERLLYSQYDEEWE